MLSAKGTIGGHSRTKDGGLSAGVNSIGGVMWCRFSLGSRVGTSAFSLSGVLDSAPSSVEGEIFCLVTRFFLTFVAFVLTRVRTFRHWRMLEHFFASSRPFFLLRVSLRVTRVCYTFVMLLSLSYRRKTGVIILFSPFLRGRVRVSLVSATKNLFGGYISPRPVSQRT